MTKYSHALQLLSSGGASNVARRMAMRSLASWSGALSFSGPESDFSSIPKQNDEEWSQALSYGSPESDFNCASLQKRAVEWSHGLSFASPEADFYKHALPQGHEGPSWSESLSFSSPEADYTSRVQDVKDEQKWSHTLSFASPDSDFSFVATSKPLCSKRDTMAYAWSFASAESDFMSSQQQQRHVHSSSQPMVDPHQLPLPQTHQEVTDDTTNRAMVVTKSTAPFEIVNVNDAWVQLCGYSKEESRHETLDKLLAGPETSVEATKLLVDDLLHGKEASTVLTNYTKSGRKFQNHVRVGPLRDVHNQVTHFVGVLEEVKDAADHWDDKHKRQQTTQS